MKLYQITVRTGRYLSHYTFNERCNGKQKYWWLIGPRGFVEIGKHRGDQPISLELELPAGKYTLGCGPERPRGIREKFRIGPNGSRRQ